MSWTDFAVVPLGPVYFGDGRPTTAGETDHGQGRFPPTPRTAQGLVRTALLQSVPGLALGRGADRQRIAALVGPPSQLPKGWQVAGPWLARWVTEDEDGLQEVEPWLPVPRYVTNVDGQLDGVRILPLADRLATDLEGVEFAPLKTARAEGYFAAAHLWELLTGSLPPLGAFQQPYPYFVAEESRVGLRIDPDKEVAEESMLYTLGWKRLKEQSGFVVRFQGGVAPEMDTRALGRGTASLGGKNRMARLLLIRSWHKSFETALAGKHLPEEPDDGAQFWLWCTTPAPVEEPWRPKLAFLPAGDVQVEIVTAVVGRLEPIGGFSLAAGRGEPVQSCVPAGSSWLISLRGGTPSQRGSLLRSLHNAFPLGVDPALRAMGFGHTLISSIPARQN